MSSYSRLAKQMAVYSVLSADYGAVDGGAIMPFVITTAIDPVL